MDENDEKRVIDFWQDQNDNNLYSRDSRMRNYIKRTYPHVMLVSVPFLTYEERDIVLGRLVSLDNALRRLVRNG